MRFILKLGTCAIAQTIGKLNLSKFSFLIILLGLLFFCPSLKAQQYELTCPAGTRAVDTLTTLDTVTGLYRQNYCVSVNGVITENIGTLSPSNINNTLYVISPGSDGCAAINAQIALLPLIAGFRSGIIDISPLSSSPQPVPCGTTVNIGSPYLFIRGPGAGALTFNCTVNGDCFNSQEGVSAVITPGFRMSGFSVHGTGTVNGVAFHAGDMVGGRFDDLAADGFTGTNGACIWFENKNFFFEDNIVNNVFCGQTPGSQLGNMKDYRWSVTTASSNNASFQYNRYHWLKYSTLANQTSFSFEGGVHNGSLWQATGNTISATGTTVIAMSGSTFPTSGVNTIVGGTWAFKSECTGCSGASFYSIPSGYTLTIDSGSIADNGGFTYTVGGTLAQALTPSPLAIPAFINYSASGARGNQYNLTIGNPASNRSLTLSDPGGNANWCLSLGCSLTAPAFIGTGAGTNFFTVQHQAAGNVYQWQASNPAGTRTLSLSDPGGNTSLSFAGFPVPVFNGTGNSQLNWHIVQDTATLAAGTVTVTFTGSSVFTNATSYTCVADDDTAIGATRVLQNSGSSITITGTGTDVVRFICVGN